MPQASTTISVILPAYNATAFLPRCLASVFAQTLPPQEIIVIDDGSTDGTAEMAHALGARVITRSNGGLSAARNTGLQHACGEWVALLDADDTWAPDKLQLQASAITPGAVLVYTGIEVLDDHGLCAHRPAYDAARVITMLRYRNPITPSSVLLKRSTVLSIGGFRQDIRACEDWELWFRLETLGDLVCVSRPLTNYYVHPMSLSANPERMLRALERILDTTLLDDLRGLERWMWRRRIWAEQLASAGLIARDNRLSGELAYMFLSLLSWPSPFWQPKRFAMLAVSARNRLLRRKGTP